MTDVQVAVTGAGGYLGSRLLSGLGRRGRGLVRTPVRYLPADRQIEIDLLDDGPGLIRAFEGVDTVVHLAGQNEVVATQQPDRALTETLLAGRHVTAAAVEARVARLVYVSTIHVYGALLIDGAVIDETMLPHPKSTYAISRLACEHLVAQGADAGLEVLVVRLSNAVGSPVDSDVDRWSLVAMDLCRQAATTGKMVLHSAGTQYRDFVALTDVCELIERCATPGAVPPGTYNLASGHPLSIRGLAQITQDCFERRTGCRPALEAPTPTGPDPDPYRICVDRLTAVAGSATTPMEEAVDELAAFCLDNHRRW